VRICDITPSFFFLLGLLLKLKKALEHIRNENGSQILLGETRWQGGGHRIHNRSL